MLCIILVHALVIGKLTFPRLHVHNTLIICMVGCHTVLYSSVEVTVSLQY